MHILFRAAAILLLLPALASGAGRATPEAAGAGRPNVLFFFTDDQRADTIAALGNPHIQTPHLDGLARAGFAFTNAYCMGSSVPAVCTPSRNMLLSGRAFFRFDRQASPEQPSFGATFRTAGYETYHHGKSGNTARALEARFEHERRLNDLEVRRSGEPGKVVVDQAIQFLRGRQRTRPFFMYLAFATPHDPRVAAARYLERYDRGKLPLPKNYLPLHPFDNGELKVRDEQLAPWPRTEDEIRKHLHDYYAVITGLDEQIGRLLGALQETGEQSRTLVIFSSDHGLALGSHGLMGKQSLYEHSMKAPLLFSGAGVPRGRSGAFTYLHDIYPTVCDLAGIPVPEGLDGRSQAPVIRGRKSREREVVFTAYRDVQRAVRRGPWKLIRYPQIHRSQLFHLENDPDERRDLAGDPAHAPRVEEMLALLREQQREYGDTLPLSAPNPRPAAVDLSFFRN